MPKENNKETSIQRIEYDLKEVKRMLDSEFGSGYSAKNPHLVQFLMDKAHQYEDRELAKSAYGQ